MNQDPFKITETEMKSAKLDKINFLTKIKRLISERTFLQES